MAKKKSDIPSVLAYEKKLVFSDGYMYGTTWEERHAPNTSEPLALVEKSVRGTISNRPKEAVQNDPAKLNAAIENPNLQRVDACALKMNQDTLKLSFTLKVLSGIEKPSACNNMKFQQSYAKAADAYIEKYGFKELAQRYAQNIANARFLWRNRLGADKLEVRVDVDGETLVFNGYDYSMKNFEADDALAPLSQAIADALCGKKAAEFIRVTCYAQLGNGQEVYPSEEMVFDKGKGDKRKVLYAVDGIAAMHSQKIGNAIRTIDTWYPSFYSAESVGPIAVEPFGAVTTLGKAFRTPKEKADFYTLFDQYALGAQLESAEQEHYVMAVLVRGGVFGLSSKENG